MRGTVVLILAVYALVLAGCTDKPGNATEATPPVAAAGSSSAPGVTPATKAQVPAGPWGTVKGQVVFAGDKVPEAAKLNVDKDQEECLSKGPLLSQKWIVNPKTNGLRNAVIFLKFEQTPPVPDELKTPQSKDVVIDQPICAFEPRIFAMRKDQGLLAKNSGGVAHNVTIFGVVTGSHNVQIPKGKEHRFEFDKSDGWTSPFKYTAAKMTCGAHPWMEGFGFVFDHPYFAITDENGHFEIKVAPAGKQRLVVWHEGIGWLGGAAGRDGREVEVKQGGVVDLGKIELKPKS